MVKIKKSDKEITTLITHKKPKAVVSEKFRGIRSNILFSTADDDIQTLLVTSDKPTSGKSTVSANIAVTYAQAGFKTLLIDGDMRKPTQHYIFNQNNITGLSNLIINKSTFEEAVHATEVLNLDVLTSGPIPPNPSELIGSTNMLEIFEELKKQYDFILVDTPPVNTVTDAQLIGELTKNAVYIIDVENNNKESVKKGKELLEKSGTKILGAILNKAPLDKSSSSYYYYGENE
ncbi:polysaccharide biosynthesis tyrosine autokinase [Mammaliicoccus fleurettii]|uniref:polysaccharide biosynthesis tyrosine autokinase n=1 Tax=Mammaliicoccus fleurettii TaxID=150056 RepID=UPI002DB7C604|nr:polysaccharide biosynthesis tyrosine autokinase [Mammaliicoccus fleurettii]MEB7806293.1 polysaccharide biosynthesis tyrosine autokinase [Mammaliicoccus fleurettii]